MLDKPFDTFNKSFDTFDKSFDTFDKLFDAFDKPFDTFDKSHSINYSINYLVKSHYVITCIAYALCHTLCELGC